MENAHNLLPEKVKEKIKQFPIYSQEGKYFESKIVVEYFIPYTSVTFLITEGEQQGEDYQFFGYITMDGTKWEWGYCMFSDIKDLSVDVRFGPHSIHSHIERELYMKGTIKEYLKAAKIKY